MPQIMTKKEDINTLKGIIDQIMCPKCNEIVNMKTEATSKEIKFFCNKCKSEFIKG